MIVYKTYKFRLFPSDSQKILINKNFGSVRFIYNHFLNDKIKTYETYKKVVSPILQVKSLYKLKEEYPWLKEVDHCSLINAIYNLDDDFKKFLKEGIYPRYKCKYRKESYRITNELKEFNNINYYSVRINLFRKVVILPKLKEIPISGYRKLNTLNGKIKFVVISKEIDKYYISVTVATNINFVSNSYKKFLGIDLGIKSYVVSSDNVKYENNIHVNEKRIIGLYKKLFRCAIGSNNRKKVIKKIEKFYVSLKNKRKTQICSIVNDILKNNDVIVVEDLNIKEMYKNHSLAKKLKDIPLFKFLETLNYKALWNNKKVVKVDRFFPSSQLCSKCGFQNRLLKDLSIREWTCPNCGSYHDRDINASINIREEGKKILNVKNII